MKSSAPLAPALLASWLAACAQAPPPGSWDLARRPPHAIEPEGGVRLAADGMAVEPERTLTFHLEVPGGATLSLRARSEGAGDLLLTESTTSAVNGDPLGEPSPLLETRASGSIRAQAGPLDPGDDLLTLELAWRNAEAPLLVESLLVSPAEPRPRPSIVFFSVDTLTARHLSTYGYPRETSPRLDEFAREAVVFESARSNACWTTPSYMSQLTGLGGGAFWSRLDDDLFEDMEWNHFYLPDPHWTLAEMLRAAGYRTGAFIDNQKMGSHLGTAQGFEIFDESAAAIPHHVPHGGARHAVTRALEWLDALPADDPVFLFVQVMDVHGPYLPTPPQRGRFTGDEHSEPREAPISYRLRGVWSSIPRYVVKPLFRRQPIPDSMDTASIISAYDEEILATDAIFGDLLAQLDRRGLDDAAVVFSADHGEAMLEHESYFSHHTVYDETIHVPLVVRFPGGLGAGERVATPVQLVDLYPTLSELAGLGPGREHLHGRSLLRHLESESSAPIEERPVLSIGGMFDGQCITYRGWKLIETKARVPDNADCLLSWPPARELLETRYPAVRGLLAGATDGARFDEALEPSGKDRAAVAEELLAELSDKRYELYYLPDDPLEQHDLSSEEPQRVAEMRALLREEARRAVAARIELDEPPVIRPPTAAELEELRNLGYVGD